MTKTVKHFDFSKLAYFARGEAIVNLILTTTQDFAQVQEMLVEQAALVLSMQNKEGFAPIKCVQFEYDLEGKVCGAKHSISCGIKEEVNVGLGMIAARDLALVTARAAAA